MKIMEDGASVHFLGVAKTLRQMVDIPHYNHLPSSPDLNPIEECWRILEDGLRGCRIIPPV